MEMGFITIFAQGYICGLQLQRCSTLVPLLPFSVQEWNASLRRLLLFALFNKTYSWFLELLLRNGMGVFASLHCSWSIRRSQYLRKEKARLSLKIPWN
jgi:hypothetical protein